MKYLVGFLVGSGVGAAAANAALVPHGEVRGYYVGAGLIFVGSAILSLRMKVAQTRNKD